MKTLSKTKGFTIVELIVVIAIIGILAGIIITNLTSAKSKSRDAKRVSDLGNIQLAVELYFDRCKQYPSSGDADVIFMNTDNGCEGTGITFANFISQIPHPPTAQNSDLYTYVTNFDKTNYLLQAKLENVNSEALKDSLDTTPSGMIGKFNPCDKSNGFYCLGAR